MNRPERRMPDVDAKALLEAGTYGVLSTVDADGAPYGVPLNYVYLETENALFFHCAMKGLKTECIGHESRVCFTVVGRSEIDAARFTTRYSSVIVRGRASLVEGDDDKRLRLRQLCDALTPGEPRRDKVIETWLPRVAIVRVDIESLSGKMNRGEDE